MVWAKPGLTTETSHRPTGLLIGLVAAVLLAGASPLLLAATFPRPADSAWGPLSVTIVAGLRYAWLIGVGERRLIELTFWLFTYVFLGLAPAVQLRSGTEPSTTPGIVSSLNGEASIVVLAGIAALGIGMVVRRSRQIEGEAPLPQPEAVVLQARVRQVATLGLFLWVYYVYHVGVTALFSSRESLNMRTASIWPDSATGALVVASPRMCLLVAFVGLVKIRQQKAVLGQPKPAVLLVLVAIALLVVVNPVSCPRYVFGTVALGMAAALGMYATPGRYRTVAILALGALLVLFPLADSFRYDTSNGLESVDLLASLTAGDFDSFAQINNAVRFVERDGSTMGRQAIGVVLFWVPRSAWPSKPVDTGILLAESRGYSFSNLSAPLWAELFVNGSWVGLVLGMATLGWYVRKWDDYIAGTLRTARVPGVLACIVPFYLILVLRGSLLQSMSYLAVISVSAAWVTTERIQGAPPPTG
jgi:hypothetical protein